MAKSVCGKTVVISIAMNRNTLFTLDERRKIARSLGVELVSLDFESIRNLTPEEFFSFLKGMGCESVIAGEDWRFGVNKTGDIKVALKLSRKFKIRLIVVKAKTIDGQRVSTSTIRKFLSKGNVRKANMMLGFNYFCDGTVTKGNSIGRKIGFPTANVLCGKDLPLPNGVYTVRFYVDDRKYNAIANLGIRPTLVNNGERVLEVHVPNRVSLNLYGKYVRVEFLDFLRGEIMFKSVEELKKQIKKDISRVL